MSKVKKEDTFEVISGSIRDTIVKEVKRLKNPSCDAIFDSGQASTLFGTTYLSVIDKMIERNSVAGEDTNTLAEKYQKDHPGATYEEVTDYLQEEQKKASCPTFTIRGRNFLSQGWMVEAIKSEEKIGEDGIIEALCALWYQFNLRYVPAEEVTQLMRIQKSLAKLSPEEEKALFASYGGTVKNAMGAAKRIDNK